MVSQHKLVHASSLLHAGHIVRGSKEIKHRHDRHPAAVSVEFQLSYTRPQLSYMCADGNHCLGVAIAIRRLLVKEGSWKCACCTIRRALCYNRLQRASALLSFVSRCSDNANHRATHRNHSVGSAGKVFCYRRRLSFTRPGRCSVAPGRITHPHGRAMPTSMWVFG